MLRSQRFCRPWERWVVALFILGQVSGCGEEPALTVGEVEFGASELVGLSEARIEELSLISAVGLALSRGEADRLNEEGLRRSIESRLLRRLDEEEALTSAGIGEETLEEWYNENPEPELEVRHLVVLVDRWASDEERAEARGRVEAALERARGGEPFAEIAGEVSEEPGADTRGGLLEPGREGSWVDEFWQAATALEVGEVSTLVETPYGIHLLKLEGRRAVPFEEARDRAVARLVLERGLLAPEEPADGSGSDAPDDRPGDRATGLAAAAERGIALSPEEEAEIRSPWRARVERWGTTLGFSRGMSGDEVADQALVALGLTGQEAAIVRQEILEMAGAIGVAYPVERSVP